MALSRKQQVFVEEYLRCWNASEAARRAGYSPKTAYSIGHENLRKPEIAQAIEARVAEKTMSADEVLVRMAEQARAGYAPYLTPDGVDLERMIADGKAHLIKGFKETAHGQVVEFYDAQTALVQIGKHYGLFTDKSDVTIHGDLTFSADEASQAQAELEEWKQTNSAAEKSNG